MSECKLKQESVTSGSVDELRVFGEAVEHDPDSICVEPGGFIYPGRELSLAASPGKEQVGYVKGEEGPSGGPPAREGQGRRASAAEAAGSAAQAVGHRLSRMLRLEEFSIWYPNPRVVRDSSSVVLITIPVGVFRTLPYRAHLLVEVPREGPVHPPPSIHDPVRGLESVFVPEIRVWAIWADGILPKAYHKYPDQSVCAFMEGEWVWGRDPLHDYIDWCVSWLGKVLHLSFFDRWPGPQHCPVNVRVDRNKPDEYCGCGGDKLWRDCCMSDDLKISPYARMMDQEKAQRAYLAELRRRGRTVTPPWGF